jgi:methylisocitrate lyase
VLTDVRRITDVCDLPLLVDVDTGFGASAFNVARTVKSMIKFGAAASISKTRSAPSVAATVRTRKSSQQEMVDRIKAAVDARTDDSFVIMARTDALAVEGLNAALDRAAACIEAGADMIFPEAITELEMYKLFADRVKAPILANITEFGATPLYTTEELASVDVSLVLYPLSAFRAMNKAAENVYTAIRRDGTKNVIDTMQTRMELYDRIDYHTFEQKPRCVVCRRRAKRWRRISQKASCKFERRKPWPKQKYSVAQACVARWPADRTVHRGPGRCRPDLPRLRRARPGRRCRVRRSRLPAAVRRAADQGRTGRLQAQAQGPA